MSFRSWILIVFILSFSGCLPDEATTRASIHNGILDLTQYSFERNPFLSLEGEWNFYYHNLPYTIKSHSPYTQMTIPNHWNRHVFLGNSLPGQGVATHRIKILLPVIGIPSLAILTSEQDTSHAIYADGVYLGGSGKVGLTEETTVPKVQSSLILIPIKPGATEMTLDLVIANFSHRKGGAWNDIILAPYEKATTRLTHKKMSETMLASVLGFVGLFFFLYLISERKSIHAQGIFSFSLIIFLRNITTGERILLDWIDLPYGVILRLEYLSWFWTAPILIRYFQNIFPFDFQSKITNYFYLLSAILTSALLLPSQYFTETASIYPIFFVLNGIYIAYSLLVAFRNKRTETSYLLTGALILLVGAINDTLHAEALIHTAYIGPISVVIFVFLQVFTFAAAIKNHIFQTKDLAKHLISVNESYSRFVPKQFLTFLGKVDIRDLTLGEQVQKKMTILFADIRNFTEFSESLSPKENFDFLNAYLQRVGPIIRHNNGFIDKFIGDAVMALFPTHPDDAIRAAVEMQYAIRTYNENRVKDNYQPIKVGIGVHTGNLILGILGEHERMEGTVISDAVNLASRIEGITKLFGAEIVISADTFIEATEDLGFDYRLLDRVSIKGKSESVYVVEVLNGYEPDKLEALRAKKDDYTFALEAYRRQDYEEARELFLEILNAIPGDNVSRIFFAECERKLNVSNVENK
ncbi:MAG: adenylate/guanylate cyclase domain-containing protein [Leptospira sp.]|nr:adenylate/guanylate cyclase domain-containing protein [Leptospira sp.]